MIKTSIIVNLQIDAIHNWPTCNVEGVDFLKYPHRHVFHITCKKRVWHSDRDIEIIKFKGEVTSYLVDKYGENVPEQFAWVMCDFKNNSCEMIATELLNKFDLTHCRVLEDGENGAECETYYDPNTRLG